MTNIADGDISFMETAMQEARLAFREGEVPVGAVLVRQGEILARSHNLRETLSDPSAHAEVLALRTAAGLLRSWRLEGATLYVTKEPCVMCSGAIINSRISRLVFGCRDRKAGGVESLYSILGDGRLNHRVEVVSGLFEQQCAQLLKDFFSLRR